MGPLDYLALPFRWIGRAIGDWFARHASGLAWTGAGLFAALIAGVAFVTFLPQILGEFAPTITNPQALYTANRPIAISFVDADGDVVGRRGAIVGQRLTLKQMPAYLPDAFIAMEDSSFWTNSGIDVKGLLRAACSICAPAMWWRADRPSPSRWPRSSIRARNAPSRANSPNCSMPPR